MADAITFGVDLAPLVKQLEGFADIAERHLDAAAQVTATRVAETARLRVARATGDTMRSIRVERAYSGHGYVVLAGTGRADAGQVIVTPSGGHRVAPAHHRGRHVARYLERGTKHMDARPFMDPAARLEEGAHQRRVQQALDQAITELGLGH